MKTGLFCPLMNFGLIWALLDVNMATYHFRLLRSQVVLTTYEAEKAPLMPFYCVCCLARVDTPISWGLKLHTGKQNRGQKLSSAKKCLTFTKHGLT